MLSVLGLDQGDSMLDAVMDTRRMEKAVTNGDEVVRYLVVRYRTESAFAGRDPILDAAADRLARRRSSRRTERDGPLPAVIPIEFEIAGTTLSLVSTVAQFGTAEDIAVADLRIEMHFPADDATRNSLTSMMPR